MTTKKIPPRSIEHSRARWLSVAIQCLGLLSALMVNLILPLIYGVEYYGEFIKSNILVFVIHKFADIVTEPLMASVEAKFIFVTCLLSSAIVIFLAQGINYFDQIGSQSLLVTMLLSSNCMIAMFALRLHRQILVHLILILGVFFILLICDYRGLMSFSILELLIWTNFVPALFSSLGLFFKGAHLPPFDKIGNAIITSLRQYLGNFTSTFVFNCLTNILPYILAKQMSALDVGVFRIVTSILQSATSLFPINTKAIFLVFIVSKERSQLMLTLMAASLFYFSLIAVCALIMTSFVPRLSPYIAMITILPVTYWAVLFERYMQAGGMRRPLIVTNLVVGISILVGAFFVRELDQAEHLYALGLCTYASFLWVTSHLKTARVTVCVVIVCSTLILWLDQFFPYATLIYMCLLAGIPFVFMKFRLSNALSLKF
jgi:hypothetical protein